MSSRDAVADALALAFVAGPWSSAKLLERGEQVLGERPRWLTPLVREVLARFTQAPNDACAQLSEVIQRARCFQRGFSPGKPRVRLRKLVLAEPSMGQLRWPVPELCTTLDVASWLQMPPGDLDWFADVRGLNARAPTTALQHYSFQWLKKQRGGYRLVEAPKTRLKAIQRRLLRDVLERVPLHDAAHGFARGRSAVSCARVHAGQSMLLRLDLEEFFPSIGAARVYRVFRGFGYPEAVAHAFTGLCTLAVPAGVIDSMPRPDFVEQYDPALLEARRRTRRRLAHRHLAQGAPTSPALANLACFRLDARLSGAARAAGAKYTRYADDLAFSGDADFARRAARFEILASAIALEEGFRVNHHKTRHMRQGQAQKLVGLVTNQRPHVPRALRDRLEATLTNILRHGLDSQNREADPQFLLSLRGQVAWIEHVHAPHAQKLRKLLAACEAQHQAAT